VWVAGQWTTKEAKRAKDTKVLKGCVARGSVQRTWGGQLQLRMQNAIADYSIYLPSCMDETIDESANAFEYDLADNLHAISAWNFNRWGIH
jgi:hypothetical protein